MKPYDANEQGVPISGPSVTDSGSWYSSLLRQLRERREERRTPREPLEITAASDPGALQKLVETPSPLVSLLPSLKAFFQDTFRPQKIETTAAPVAVQEIWSKQEYRVPGMLSLAAHAAAAILLLIPWISSSEAPAIAETAVLLYTPPPLFLHLPPDSGPSSGGGGGGGQNQLTAPSLGELPRAADIQLAPPTPEVRALDPDLIVEPTIIAPQLAHLPRQNILPLGLPTGIPGPPSAGPGSNGGIGTGNRGGVGEGTGPGVGPGQDGGIGGDVYRAGGGVTLPQVTLQVEPEYSDEARRARYTGKVLLRTIFRRDGTIEVLEVLRQLGMGLDQNAIAALDKWEFVPGLRDGQPVDVEVNVEVTFRLH